MSLLSPNNHWCVIETLLVGGWHVPYDSENQHLPILWLSKLWASPISCQMKSESKALPVKDDYEPHLKARAISAHIPLARTRSPCRTREAGKYSHTPPPKEEEISVTVHGHCQASNVFRHLSFCLSPAKYTVDSFNTRRWS